MRNSFTDDINPADFRYSGAIKSESVTKTNGIAADPSITTHYSGVLAKKLVPLRSGAGDQEEALQVVGVEKNSWLIRAEDRNISRKMYFEVSSKKHHITDFRIYRSNPEFLVLDTEYRDNE